MDNKRARIGLLAVAAFAVMAVNVGLRPALAEEVLFETKEKIAPPEHYKILIDAKAAEKDLLPIPPKQPAAGCVAIPSSLADVPEVMLHEPVLITTPKDTAQWKREERDAWAKAREKAIVHNARLTTHINHLNLKKTDHFLDVLTAHRADLAGLPFMMGDACRLKAGDRQQFKDAVTIVQGMSLIGQGKSTAAARWQSYDELRRHKSFKQVKDQSCVAACMQMMATDSCEMQRGLIQRLAKYDGTKADRNMTTAALTKLAIFSPEKEIRDAALAALQKRGGAVDTALVLHGLRYPWPSVADNTTAAIVQLKRTDLIPELVKVLDEPDPRAPAVREKSGKKESVVREVVRINHHRNCLLCHPPGNTPDVMTIEPWNEDRKRELEPGVEVMFANINKQAEDVLVGAMPTPGEEFPSFGGYREFSSPNLLVRADVTYLRQDFSLPMKVANAHPWPEAQRFDFLVRSRVLSEQQSEAYRAEFALRDGPTPYHQAARTALQRLTGRDAGATAQAWRAALATE